MRGSLRVCGPSYKARSRAWCRRAWELAANAALACSRAASISERACTDDDADPSGIRHCVDLRICEVLA
eukprot:381420-Rhodomonas_salina.1